MNAERKTCRTCGLHRDPKFFRRTVDGIEHEMAECIHCVNERAGRDIRHYEFVRGEDRRKR